MPHGDQVSIPSERQGQHVRRQIVGIDRVGTGFRLDVRRFVLRHKCRQGVEGREGTLIKVLETPCEVRMDGSKRAVSVMRSNGNNFFTLINVHLGGIIGGCSPLNVRLAGSFRDLRQQGLNESMNTRRGGRRKGDSPVPGPLLDIPRRPWQTTGARYRVLEEQMALR